MSLQQNQSLKMYSYIKKWCEECQSSYEGGCAQHHVNSIHDVEVLPRAFATLPHSLAISRMNSGQAGPVPGFGRGKRSNRNGGTSWSRKEENMSEVQNKNKKFVHFAQDDNDEGKDNNEDDEMIRGVFAKQRLPARTQFGPLICRFAKESETINPQKFPLLLDGEDGITYQCNLSDVDTCNWMMFIRPASSSTNQNLVAFQHDQSILYTSTKDIEVGQELRVWYAKPYAERLGKPLLREPTKQEPENCTNVAHIESNETSKTSRVKELTEKKSNTQKQIPSTRGIGSMSRTRKRRKVTSFVSEKDKKVDYVDDDAVKYELEEEIETNEEEVHGDDDDYHPKQDKKSARKSKKRRRVKQLPSSKETSGGEWSCEQCDLIFSNPSVLNLHTLVHAAEDVGFASDDKRRVDELPQSNMLTKASEADKGVEQRDSDDNSLLSLMTLTCPVCSRDFETKTDLVVHVGQHGSSRQSLLAQSRPFKCQLCLKTFGLFERLQQHLLCHGDESMKPLACEVCKRRFMNPAALAVHMKTHSDRKYYACPLCPESFEQIQKLRAHAEERHLERTIKAFDPTMETARQGEEVCIGFGDENNGVTIDNQMSTSLFTGDSTCAAVAIATATNAITNEVWIGAVHPSSECPIVATMATEGELEFMGDGGQCLFTEVVTTNSEQIQGANQVTNAGDADLHHFLEMNSGNENSIGSKQTDKALRGGAEGTYHCPECHRVFTEFSAISRHIRLFHSCRSFECKDCGRTFPRRDKLRLHALRHSNHREFVCETCGRQFKRKDKLRDHLRRQHDPSKKNDPLNSTAKKKNPSAPSFTPEISPLDFMKFMFKCQKCLLGFKRRGMLVNHLAKKHPDVPMDSVPELNLPILTSRHDFFCQYCSKVFKSSSKRKFHILKHHPGSELPASLRPRKKQAEAAAAKATEGSSAPRSNASFSTPSGHLASEPYSCDMCHRQYTSKSKLLQHQRKKHSSLDGGKTSATGKSLDFANELDGAAVAMRSSATGGVEVNPATSSELDYSELFVGAPIFFAPKGSNPLEFSGEGDITSSGSVLVLSNDDDILMQGSTHLGFAKTMQAQVGHSKSHQQPHQHQQQHQQQHQTVIIDPDVFAQAVNELTKSYAAKNSVLVTRYDPQQHHYSHDGAHSDVISLTVDGGSRFGALQHQEGARLLQVAPIASTAAIVAPPFVSVVDYEQLYSVAPHDT